MTRRELLLKRVAELPDELLPELEQSVDEIVQLHRTVYRLSPDELAAVQRGIEAADRGDFASEAELEALLARREG